MRDKLALAATVGTLALAPPTVHGDAPREPSPIVQLDDGAGRPVDRRRVVFRAQADYRWLETWAPPRFYAGDRPVVRRRRAE